MTTDPQPPPSEPPLAKQPAAPKDGQDHAPTKAQEEDRRVTPVDPDETMAENFSAAFNPRP
jgi:hypothetical protein